MTGFFSFSSNVLAVKVHCFEIHSVRNSVLVINLKEHADDPFGLSDYWLCFSIWVYPVFMELSLHLFLLFVGYCTIFVSVFVFSVVVIFFAESHFTSLCHIKIFIT